MVHGQTGPSGGMQRRDRVIDREGVEAFIDAELTGPPRVRVLLPEGEHLEIETRELVHDEGVFRLPIAFSQLRGSATTEVTIPCIEERIVTSRRKRTTAVVRVDKRVREREEIVDEPVHLEEVEVRRVPIGRDVETASPVREEGDTLVIPVHEEVLVVTRRLVLKEELRITRTSRREPRREVVSLKSEEVEVSRREVP